MPFFELRQYRMRPGKKEAWVRYMEETIIPYQQTKGMVIVGSFTGEEEEDLYVWIRRFESEEERQGLYEAVYENDYWKHEVRPKVAEMIDLAKNHITRIEATPRSIIR